MRPAPHVWRNCIKCSQNELYVDSILFSFGPMFGGGAVNFDHSFGGLHMRHIISVLGVIGISAALMTSPVRAWEPDQLPPSYTLGLNAGTAHMGGRSACPR